MGINDDSASIIDSLPWSEIVSLSKTGSFGEKFNTIPESTLKFALDENNYIFLIQSALRSLEQTDPLMANNDNAEKLASLMREFARRIIEERNPKGI